MTGSLYDNMKQTVSYDLGIPRFYSKQTWMSMWSRPRGQTALCLAGSFFLQTINRFYSFHIAMLVWTNFHICSKFEHKLPQYPDKRLPKHPRQDHASGQLVFIASNRHVSSFSSWKSTFLFPVSRKYFPPATIVLFSPKILANFPTKIIIRSLVKNTLSTFFSIMADLWLQQRRTKFVPHWIRHVYKMLCAVGIFWLANISRLTKTQ